MSNWNCGSSLKHDVILVELCKDRRDLPLAKSVVQCVIDRLGVIPKRDAVSRSMRNVARGAAARVSAVKSCNCGSDFSFFSRIGAQRASSLLLPSCSVY